MAQSSTPVSKVLPIALLGAMLLILSASAMISCNRDNQTEVRTRLTLSFAGTEGHATLESVIKKLEPWNRDIRKKFRIKGDQFDAVFADPGLFPGTGVQINGTLDEKGVITRYSISEFGLNL